MINPAVLIVAYRRVDNVNNLLSLCRANGINKIYIAVDGPKDNSAESIKDYKFMLNVINIFSYTFEGTLNSLIRDTNLGCSASILSACNWVFQQEEYAIILEDDCLPNADFFEYSKLGCDLIQRRDEVWLSCGAQFAPNELITDSWTLSSYPLNWGWTTSRKKWNEILYSILNPQKLTNDKFSIWERAYWNAGSYRAQLGLVDVWDTVLAQQMLQKNKFALVPKYNLVTNVGFDKFATNTKKFSKWLDQKTMQFTLPMTSPQTNSNLDYWIANNYFKISRRHLFSTNFTRVKDILFRRINKKKFLKNRFNNAERKR